MDNIINMKFLELEKAHREYLIKGNMNLFNEYTEKRVWDLVDLNERSLRSFADTIEDALGTFLIPLTNFLRFA